MHYKYKIIAIYPGDPAPPARLYKTEKGAFSAAQRFAEKIERPHRYTSAGVCHCPLPGGNDAAGWDRYRLRHGIGGCHH